MLRQTDNTSIHFSSGLFTRRGWVTLHVGARKVFRLRKIHQDDFAEGMEYQRKYPLLLGAIGGRNYWHFQDRFYTENEGLDASAVHALLVTRQMRQAQRIDRAQQIVAMGTTARGGAIRGAIPEDVKHLVWTRDKGRCRACGDRSELQFDHIIPVAMGGSSDPANLQILCGPCNRRKGASITTRRGASN